MIISISGPVGSGKTTQAEILAKELSIPLIDTGNLLRELPEESTEGQAVKKALESGGIVDDEIVARVVKKRIEESDCQNGFIMDGYPRRLSQLQEFDPGFDHIFYLDIDDSEVMERLSKRGRSDDLPEVIAKRLDLYHELTEPVLEYYQKQGILHRIDGCGSVTEVAERVKSHINHG